MSRRDDERRSGRPPTLSPLTSTPLNPPRAAPSPGDDDTLPAPRTLSEYTLSIAPNALPTGFVLGEFEIERVIGEGGFSIVYLAIDQQLMRRVAIKEYLPNALALRLRDLTIAPRSERHNATFAAGLRSFVNEARLLAQFDHPSLVKVHRFWEERGTAYMVMPYYQGITLSEWRRQHGAPAEAWLRELLRALLDALAQLHGLDCYHRDVAPDNILLLPGDQPVLLDLGAARRIIGDMTQALTVILKPGYAPVEQYAEVASMKQGAWTDLYALAAVMYFLIAGRAPPPAVARMVVDEMPPARVIGAGRYAPALLAAIDAALGVLPENRPQDITAFQALLEREPTPSATEPEIRPSTEPETLSSTEPDTPPDSRSKDIAAFRALLERRENEIDSAPQRDAAEPPTTRTIPTLTLSDQMAESTAHAEATDQQTATTSLSPADKPGARFPLRVVVPVAVAVVALVAIFVWAEWPAPSTPPAPPPAAANVAADTPAVEAPPPAQSAQPAPAAQPVPTALTSHELLQQVFAARSPSVQVRASASAAQLRIGRDELRFTVGSNVNGYVYVLLAGTDTDRLLLMFPNRSDGNNQISRNASLVLPRPAWRVVAGGPPGVNRLLVLVSPRPRDFAAAGLQRADPFAEFAPNALSAAIAKDGPIALAGTTRCAAGAANCDTSFGAALLEVVEVPQSAATK